MQSKQDFKIHVRNTVQDQIKASISTLEDLIEDREYVEATELYIESITVLEKIRQKVENDEI